MKKLFLFAVVLFATISFTSCTDLNDDDEFFQDTVQLDPKEDGTIKDTDPDDDGEG
jgi:hypothetical protein